MTKPNMILLHGALGASGQLKKVKELLTEDFEVFDLNFSGHGGTPYNEEGFGIEIFVDEVLQFMNRNGLDQSNFYGYSMGGFVALVLAANYPERVEKVVTLGTKFDWTPHTAQQEIKHLNPDKIIGKVPKFAQFLERVHAPNDWKVLLKNTSEMMIGLGEINVLTTMDFTGIQNEVIIGIGTEDTMVTLEESEFVAKELPNGTLRVFEGFKHPMEQIDVAVLCKEIIGFLAVKNDQ